MLNAPAADLWDRFAFIVAGIRMSHTERDLSLVDETRISRLMNDFCIIF